MRDERRGEQGREREGGEACADHARHGITRWRCSRRSVLLADIGPVLWHGVGAVGDGAAGAQGCGYQNRLGDLLIAGLRGACFL